MPPPQCLVFGPFRLDRHDERLWCGQQPLPLSPRTFAVLQCLLSQAGQLVTKDALLQAVWPATAVSESSLTVAIRQLRRLLGDQTRPHRFIETVHGRGYRFITPVSTAVPPAPSLPQEMPHPALSPRHNSAPLLVGREAELVQLAQWWSTVQQGQRQMGMVMGEPGIGKTALVQAFVAQVRATADVWIGHGQCVDHYGTGEAYLPVLEALGRLGRGPEGAPLVAVLRQYAPSWLVHLPALLTIEERQHLEHLASGGTSARMLRELAEALEVLTAIRPLVLVLEDLHWSDRATLTWLAYVVRRGDPARLLVLGTSRLVNGQAQASALRALVAELRHHPQYAELELSPLPATAIAVYLQQRCGVPPAAPGLPRLVHWRTGGNPLFLVALMDEFVRQRLLESAGDAAGNQRLLAALSAVIPTGLRRYIEQHIVQLSEADQALLEAASVAGSTFAVAAVATGVGQAPAAIEARYTALARQGQFLRARGTETWPDGTVTACYQFRHALYHEVVYARLSAGYRVHLHRQIGLRKEAGYGAQAWQIAAELAVHFARGQDAWRALRYLHYAGENALRRSAYQEAIAQLTAGRALLASVPETPARQQHELGFLMALIQALGVTQGEAAPELESILHRAALLGQQVTELPQRFAILFRLWAFQNVRSACQAALPLAAQLLDLAQDQQEPAMLLGARYALGQTLLNMGALAPARLHLEHGIAQITPQQPALSQATPGGSRHYGVTCRSYLSRILWMLGYPDQALRRGQEALSMAQAQAHPFGLVDALFGQAHLHRLRREWAQAQAHAEAMLALATEYGFARYVARGTLIRGLALVAQEQAAAGLVQMQQGLAAYRATGTAVSLPDHLAQVAVVYGQLGQVAAGLPLIAEALALVQQTGECREEADVHRVHGVLLLRQTVLAGPEAAACFQQALAVARRQQARSYELRAATSLARLWQQQRRQAAAYELLEPVYGWFSEGFDTADLQEARALLEELKFKR